MTEWRWREVSDNHGRTGVARAAETRAGRVRGVGRPVLPAGGVAVITIPQYQLRLLQRGTKRLHLCPRDDRKLKPFVVGLTYAVQGVSYRDTEDGGRVRQVTGEAARVRVEGIWRDVLTPDFDLFVAQDAGFADLDDLFAYWRETYREGRCRHRRCGWWRSCTSPRPAGWRGAWVHVVPVARYRGGGECPPKEWQDRFSAEASARDHELRERRAEAEQQERWRSKRKRGRGGVRAWTHRGPGVSARPLI